MADLQPAQQLHELTYERQDINLRYIDPKMLEQNCPLAQLSSIAGSNTSSLQTLGQLDLLPLEIIQSILQLLDLQALTLMQSINHRSKLLVDSLPQHREIVTHAPNALRAILSTGLSPQFTINDLSTALRAQGCFSCGGFGTYLYLLECRRYCWLCVAEHPDIQPVSRSVAMILFRLPAEIIQQLPCMQSLPLRYSIDGAQRDGHGQRVALVSLNAARQAGIKFHGSEEAMEARVLIRATYPNSGVGSGISSWVRRRKQMQNRRRGSSYGSVMASIRFPTLDASSGTLEWGLSCKGCRDGPTTDNELDDGAAIYTRRGYLAHYEECKWSKHLQASLKLRGLVMSETS